MTWIKRLLGIGTLETQLKALNNKLNETNHTIVSDTTKLSRRIRRLEDMNIVDADIGHRTNSTVIVTGIVRGKPYVQFYDLEVESFEEVIKYLKVLKEHHKLRHIDSPHKDLISHFLGEEEL